MIQTPSWPLRMQPSTTPCLGGPQLTAGGEGTGPWRRRVRKRSSTKGARIHHPQATKRSGLCPGLRLSSGPTPGPSSVQVVAGSPDERKPTSARAWLQTPRRRRGKLTLDTKTARKACGVKTGHLRMAIWRTTAWGHMGCDWGKGVERGRRRAGQFCRSLWPQSRGGSGEAGWAAKGLALGPQPHTSGLHRPPLSPLLPVGGLRSLPVPVTRERCWALPNPDRGTRTSGRRVVQGRGLLPSCFILRGLSLK